ncbi:hypothetical protein BB558_000160 [Smittium angustum]|nr:hypothetical protein BB558_000160 [Smittium angustum]
MEGLTKNSSVEAKLFQFEETLPKEILIKSKSPPKDESVPIFTLKDLEKGDAFMFGFPTRYGIMPSQVKSFWDSTGGLWMKGALQRKMAGTFFSTGSQSGGQETTALTFLTTLSHHGMIYVPMGYSHKNLNCIDEVVGGSAYGSGTVAGGDGSRQPSEKEKEIAVHHGSMFAEIVAQYHKK